MPAVHVQSSPYLTHQHHLAQYPSLLFEGFSSPGFRDPILSFSSYLTNLLLFNLLCWFPLFFHISKRWNSQTQCLTLFFICHLWLSDAQRVTLNFMPVHPIAYSTSPFECGIDTSRLTYPRQNSYFTTSKTSPFSANGNSILLVVETKILESFLPFSHIPYQTHRHIVLGLP